jgi:hypothetical protein
VPLGEVHALFAHTKPAPQQIPLHWTWPALQAQVPF